MNRNFGLDLVRAVSIWLVLLQHAGFNIPGLHPLKIGGIGVEVFFVMSGFLIGGILFKEISKGNSLYDTLKSFWIRRWFRILPLYYLIIFFKFLVIDDSIGWNVLYYVFFLQNNFFGISFMDVSWSLVIEEWFYLFSPIFLFFVTRYLKSDMKILVSIILFILTVIVFRIVYVGVTNAPYGAVNGNFPFRFDSLFVGVLLSFLKFKKWAVFDKISSLPIMLLGLFSFIGYIFIYWNWANPVNNINEMIFPRTIGFFILPCTIGLIIPYTSTIKIAPDNFIKRLSFSFITYTSILTYALYLIHPFIYGVTDFFQFSNYEILKFPIEIVITYGISLLVYLFFEKPILNYRDRLTISKR